MTFKNLKVEQVGPGFSAFEGVGSCGDRYTGEVWRDEVLGGKWRMVLRNDTKGYEVGRDMVRKTRKAILEIVSDFLSYSA